jgi:cytochrome c-type biogenesis protein CcmH/NrfG
MSLSGKWYGFGRDPAFDAGLRAFEGEDFELASELFREVAEGKSDADLRRQARSFLVNALSRMGQAALREGRNAEARQAFLEAVELEPRYPDLWLQLARASGRLEDEATERGALETARRLHPTYPRALLYEAMRALRKGDREGAQEALDALPQEAAPDGEDELLLDSLEAVFETEGGEANRLANQAAQSARQHQYEIAATLYREAAQLEPGYADIRCRLGETLMELDELDEAEHHLRAALEINPRYADAWAQLGIALKRQKREKEAKEAFREAHKLDPHHPIARFELRLGP